MAHDKLAEARTESTTAAALRGALEAGRYPSDITLREFGAKGNTSRIRVVADRLIDSGIVTLPPELLRQWTLRRRGSAAPPRPPKAVVGEERPADDPFTRAIREYRAAWRRLHVRDAAKGADPCP